MLISVTFKYIFESKNNKLKKEEKSKIGVEGRRPLVFNFL